MKIIIRMRIFMHFYEVASKEINCFFYYKLWIVYMFLDALCTFKPFTFNFTFYTQLFILCIYKLHFKI